MPFSKTIAQDNSILSNAINCVRGKNFLVIFALVLLPVLTACSFRPLHGPTNSNQQLSAVLSSIDIATIPGRVGQRVRNELIFRFTGGQLQSEPHYRLTIALREQVLSTLVQVDGDSRGQVYQLDAKFELFRNGEKEPLLKGISKARAAFQDDPSVLANIRARHDAENRAAKTIAEDLTTRLSAFLSGNS